MVLYMDEHAPGVRHQSVDDLSANAETRNTLHSRSLDKQQTASADWAVRERHSALGAFHQANVRAAPATTSGWRTDVTGNDPGSVPRKR